MTELERKCALLREMLARAGYAVFFGGAGVSTDSGLIDFRSAKDGLYNRPCRYSASPEKILTPGFYREHTAEFFDFYRTELLNLAAPPNSVHYALAEMERAGLIKCVITQNADNLHQRAGSKNVIDIHGNVYINTCEGCGKRFPPEAVADCAGVPRCDACGGVIRPGILLFGEVPDMHAAMAAIREINRSDLLIAGGTSLKVSSAPRLLDRYKGRFVIINAEPTPYDSRADLVINAGIAEVFSRIWP